jgi:hypothetical protein
MAPKEDPVQSTHISYDDQGAGTATSITKSGKVLDPVPLGNIGKSAKATGALTANQQFQQARQGAKDKQDRADRLAEHQAAETAHNGLQVEINRLNDQEQVLHKNNLDIGNRLKAGKTPEGVPVTAADAVALHTQLGKNAVAIDKLQSQQAARKQKQNDIVLQHSRRQPIVGYGEAAAPPAQPPVNPYAPAPVNPYAPQPGQ